MGFEPKTVLPQSACFLLLHCAVAPRSPWELPRSCRYEPHLQRRPYLEPYCPVGYPSAIVTLENVKFSFSIILAIVQVLSGPVCSVARYWMAQTGNDHTITDSSPGQLCSGTVEMHFFLFRVF